jgi:hypoxanthine phosphoribosyltransferase
MAAPIELQRPLITSEQIESRVGELGGQINRDYAGTGRPVSIVVVLKGAAFFAVDLMKRLDLPTRMDFLQAHSYSGVDSTGEVTLIKDVSMPLAGTDVLIVEDIVDTGLTASWLLRHLSGHHPATCRLVTLLDKPSRRIYPVEIDYTGFTIPDEFVLGYGLDYDEGYRNLPAIYTARPLPD